MLVLGIRVQLVGCLTVDRIIEQVAEQVVEQVIDLVVAGVEYIVFLQM